MIEKTRGTEPTKVSYVEMVPNSHLKIYVTPLNYEAIFVHPSRFNSQGMEVTIWDKDGLLPNWQGVIVENNIDEIFSILNLPMNERVRLSGKLLSLSLSNTIN